MKKCVPWALSGLPAVRPSITRFGFDMIGSPVSASCQGRSGMVRPEAPVAAIRIASSSFESGAGSFGEVQDMEPAATS